MHTIIFILIFPIVAGFIIAATKYMERTFNSWFYQIKNAKYHLTKLSKFLSKNAINKEIKRQKKINKENLYHSTKLPKLKKDAMQSDFSNREKDQNEKNKITAERLTHVKTSYSDSTAKKIIPPSELPEWLVKIIVYFVNRQR